MNVVRLVLMVPVNVLESLVVEGWMLLLMLMVLLLWGLVVIRVRVHGGWQGLRDHHATI